MSGPAVHHLVSDLVAEELRSKLDASFEPFLNRLSGEFAPYLHFGAQGPDFLFFNTKDIHPVVARLVDRYFDIVDFVERFKQRILDAIPERLLEAIDRLEEAAENVAERSAAITEIQQILGESRDLLEILSKDLQERVKEYISDSRDLFGVLKHPIQDGQDHDAWWWFDTLHYRRTGQYASALLRNAPPGSAEHAYALGYLSHFATDTVGHPFVNIVSGGPYRTHAQRHKFVENHQDVFAFDAFTGTEFTQSGVAEQYVMEGDDTRLPAGLNALIRNSLRDVYFRDGAPLYGVEVSADELDDTYRLWLQWFRGSTNALDLPVPEPYSLTEELAEAWQTFVDNVEGAVDLIADATPGSGGILGFLQTLGAAILGAVLLALALVDFVLGALLTLGAAPIRFLISVAYEALYNAFMNFHHGLALNGFVFPFRAQLVHPRSAHVLNAARRDHFGNNALALSNVYPTQKFTLPGLERESHLVYPFPVAQFQELDHTLGAPRSYYSADPLHYIRGNIRLSPKHYRQLRDFVEAEGTLTEAQINERFQSLRSDFLAGRLGNATEFTCFLYQQFLDGETIADFNLDADRGLGFKCWRKVAQLSDLNRDAAPVTPVEVDTATQNNPANQVLNTRTDIIDPSPTIL